MRYFRSEHSFRRYEPPKSKTGSFFAIFKKKKKKVIVHSFEKSYSNPYRIPRRRNYGRLKIYFFIFLLAGWLGLMLYLPYFRINKITYQGLKIIKQEEMDKEIGDNFLRANKILPYNNYFFVRAGSIAKYLEKKFSVNSIRVIKVFPNKLRVEVEEKVSTAIYDNGFHYYLLDQSGSAIKYLGAVGSGENVSNDFATSTTVSSTASASSTPIITTSTFYHVPDLKRIKKEYGDYPIIYDARQLLIAEKQEGVLRPAVVQAVIDWRNLSEKKGIVSKSTYFMIEEPIAGVTVFTTAPWRIYFQPADDVGAQLDNLKVILQNNAPKEYIDLRYGDKVYWK